MKTVVLFSAGLDSTVNLYAAHKLGKVILALTFDYGQKAAKNEILMAKKQTSFLGVPHEVVSLPFFKSFTQTSLLNQHATVPAGEELELDSLAKSLSSAEKVWVPNRNGIFLNLAAGYAEGLGAEVVVPGFNKEEASTFPDNSEAFMKATSHALNFSTANGVRVHGFTGHLEKPEIFKMALELGVQLGDIWPCYLGGEKPCLQCESCLRFVRAAELNGIEAPKIWSSK